MPTYEYSCPEHGTFEEFHSITIKLEFCPKCKEAGKEQTVSRLISLGSKGIVELSGQDLVDKCKADAKQMKSEMYKSETKYANMIGESHYQNLQQKIDNRKRNK